MSKSNFDYEAWLRVNTNLGARNVSKYTPEQLAQFRLEREAKRLLEAPEREAKWAEFVRLSNLPPEPPFGWDYKQMRKIFYTTCSFILLQIVTQLETFDLPKTIEITSQEKIHYRDMIYQDLKHLITQDYINIHFQSIT
jgi:hypothetical protein